MTLEVQEEQPYLWPSGMGWLSFSRLPRVGSPPPDVFQAVDLLPQENLVLRPGSAPSTVILCPQSDAAAACAKRQEETSEQSQGHPCTTERQLPAMAAAEPALPSPPHAAPAPPLHTPVSNHPVLLTQPSLTPLLSSSAVMCSRKG